MCQCAQCPYKILYQVMFSAGEDHEENARQITQLLEMAGLYCQESLRKSPYGR